MTESKAKPKAKGTPKPAAKKTASAGSKAKEPSASESASQLIDQRIRELADWRGETLARMRSLILEACPEMTEDWKWSNPVWSHHGIVCTGETYKKVVKLTFARGASIPDPSGLFNSSLTGNTRRAIDITEETHVDTAAFKTLVKAAAALNNDPSAKKTRSGASKIKQGAGADKPVKLLSGGNPQIAKADGDAPVQAYIAAMPGWKHDLGKRLDSLIVRAVPHVRRAVRWNTPFYGVEGQGWFLGFHCVTKYIKVAFFRGKSLDPVPPGESKQKEVRYLDIYEDDELDEVQFTSWVKQASELPGWKL